MDHSVAFGSSYTPQTLANYIKHVLGTNQDTQQVPDEPCYESVPVAHRGGKTKWTLEIIESAQLHCCGVVVLVISCSIYDKRPQMEVANQSPCQNKNLSCIHTSSSIKQPSQASGLVKYAWRLRRENGPSKEWLENLFLDVD